MIIIIVTLFWVNADKEQGKNFRWLILVIDELKAC